MQYTRGLITTQLVRDYIVTNPEVGDREIGYITAAFQRTAAVALSGGTGEEAAAQIMGVISAYGMEELGDVIQKFWNRGLCWRHTRSNFWRLPRSNYTY